jgi:hypothetical protein
MEAHPFCNVGGWTFCNACSYIGRSQSQLNLHMFAVVKVAQHIEVESSPYRGHYEVYASFELYFASSK